MIDRELERFLRHFFRWIIVASAPRHTDSVDGLAALLLNLLLRLRSLIITTSEGIVLEERIAINVDSSAAWVAHGADWTLQTASR